MLPWKVVDALAQANDAKIVLLVLDGLGDIANHDHGGKTALELAKTPNLDALTRESICGRFYPVAPGITPGSGPGHLSLFGYDPLEYEIGRGILEAVGVGMELQEGDVAARANFCSLENGLISDRRAGRIATDLNLKLVEELKKIGKVGDVELILQSGVMHRFVVVFRGAGLVAEVADTDPQQTGTPIKECKAVTSSGQKLADAVNTLTTQGCELLKDHHPANGFLLRGFSGRPQIPSVEKRFKLNPCCIASYPMYRGLASLVGMKLIPTGKTPVDEVKTLAEQWANYNFFFVHIKETDSAGEDGNLKRKVEVIEEIDALLPQILALMPDVLCITGDHSTPPSLMAHSWHPVPVLIAGKNCGKDRVERFTENDCNTGGLGFFEGKYLFNLLLANAGKLAKYGA